MWGFALLQFRKSPGSAGLGFLFFCVFGIAEITRQMIALLYINRLRAQYVASSDPTTLAEIRTSLSSAGLLTAPLFGVFILTFGLGSLCYGLSLTKSTGFTKLISIMFFISGIASFVLLGNDFWENAPLGNFMSKYNATFTPLLRTLLGVWLWRKGDTLGRS
jgi:hypothetical protein